MATVDQQEPTAHTNGAGNGKTIAVENPATGQTIGHVPDLSADEGTFAAPENDPPIRHERLVARIARDLDIADGDPRLGW